MRYVRCRECGSTEVPTLATCPTCGIKTPITIRTRWWLVAAFLGVGLAAGAAGGAAFLGRSGPDHPPESQTAEPRVGVGRERSPGLAALQRRLDELERTNEALRAKLDELVRRKTPTPPVEPPEAAVADDQLRAAQVQWVAAYMPVSRVWRAPYVPLTHVGETERQIDDLAARTRQLAAALPAGSGPGPVAPAALTAFERRLLDLRRAVQTDRWHRVTVSAQSDWTESDVDVRRDDVVYLRARGGWTMAVPQTLEDGSLDFPAEPLPLVGALPLGGVLWRVGGSPDIQALVPEGTSATVRAEADGVLQFRINEQRLDDNVGAVAVEVMLLPKALISELDAVGKVLVGG